MLGPETSPLPMEVADSPLEDRRAEIVESDRQEALAEAFTKIAKDLPQEFKVFSNLKDAEDWVKE